jgi:hypothetical protein
MVFLAGIALGLFFRVLIQVPANSALSLIYRIDGSRGYDSAAVGYPIGGAARLFAREAVLPTEYHEHEGQGHQIQRVRCHGSALNSPEQYATPPMQSLFSLCYVSNHATCHL